MVLVTPVCKVQIRRAAPFIAARVVGFLCSPEAAAAYEKFGFIVKTQSNVNRSVGASYFGKGHDRKIQLDYTKKTESPVELDNDEVRLSVISVF